MLNFGGHFLKIGNFELRYDRKNPSKFWLTRGCRQLHVKSFLIEYGVGISCCWNSSDGNSKEMFSVLVFVHETMGNLCEKSVGEMVVSEMWDMFKNILK